MTRRKLRLFALAALMAPLALAACGESGESTAELSGAPIEDIAPPEGQIWSEIIAQTDAGGYRMGNPDAPIKLIEYGSLTCPHCATFAAESGEELRDTFVKSGRVSFEFRNFIMNPLDLTMAMLTRCGTPESFFALKEQTFADQQTIINKWTQAGEAQAQQAASLPAEHRYKAIASLADLPEFFAARGISTDQSGQCLADTASAELLVNNTNEQSQEYEITGTPAFLINGSKIDENGWTGVKTALETAGAR
ncbi:MAG: DsbA family protein [Sphingomonadaceae bacterium]|nr:DsbA family protein [Sphingomonadaceae bacterium]